MCAETPNILTQPWWTEKLFGWQTVEMAISGKHVAHILPDNDLKPHFVRTDCLCFSARTTAGAQAVRHAVCRYLASMTQRNPTPPERS